MHKINKKIFQPFILIFISIIFFVSGVYTGQSKMPDYVPVPNLANQNIPKDISADFEPFWKVWNLLNEKYQNSKITDQEKVWGAVKGLADSLGDPYTVFFPPEESKFFNETINGSFGGVGMEVGIKDRMLTVISPLKDTPAYKAGIKTGDKIVKIDETNTRDLSIDKAVSLIRGEKGTVVKITIIREGESEPKEIDIIRDIISIPTLETEKRSDGVFVIRLFNFSGNSTTLFRNALREFVESKSNKLLLDLRGNPGGYLDAAIDMSSWFLPASKQIVIEDFGGVKDKKIYRSKGYNIFNKNLKMVILVDGGSASASEILAGALNEHGIAKLVGVKTFGKGSVQELVSVTEDTSLKVTIAKWLTPNGISISDNGLTPDFIVENDKSDKENTTSTTTSIEKDAQLDKAIEVLNNWPKK